MTIGDSWFIYQLPNVNRTHNIRAPIKGLDGLMYGYFPSWPSSFAYLDPNNIMLIAHLYTGHDFIKLYYTYYCRGGYFFKNSFLQFTLKVFKLLLNHSSGILPLSAWHLFANALRPTFLLLFLIDIKWVWREVKIWLKFRAAHSSVHFDHSLV